MELSQGKIIQKQKMQELSSLFMTHRLNVMHAPIKFHEYIVCVAVLRPSQPNGVMSSAVSLPNHTFTGQA